MFSLLKKLNPYAFIIALALGIMYSYLVQPSPTIIIKYPTPENSPVYKDSAGLCYKYNSSNVSCPTNDSDISKIPIQ